MGAQLGVHQPTGDAQVTRPEGIGQKVGERRHRVRVRIVRVGRYRWQQDVELLGGHQFVQELPAIPARRGTDRQGLQTRFTVEPGVVGGGLLGMHREAQGDVAELEVRAQIQAGPTRARNRHAGGHGPDLVVRDRHHRIGLRHRQQLHHQGSDLSLSAEFAQNGSHLVGRQKTTLFPHRIDVRTDVGRQGVDGCDPGGTALRSAGHVVSKVCE